MRINCKEASRLMSMGLDRELSFSDRAALRLHLAVCSACNVVKSQFEFMRRALATYSRPDRDDE
jgi:anti-sigma factor RsiW